MKTSELRKLIREEVRNVVSEKQKLNEDMSLVGDIALGVAGGLAGLWALVRGTPVVLSALGSVAGEIASSIQDKAKKAAAKAKREGRLETIKPIVAKFANDTKLKDMYKALPEYSNSITSKAGMQNKERAKQMRVIAKYIETKLTPDEMQYFTDIASMLRTGDIR
jgi:hypothetical protein